MSGVYSLLIQGEIVGLKIGIGTKMSLWQHTQKLNYEELNGEYLVGFGVGFEKGQQIKKKLSVKNTQLDINEKISLMRFLINKHTKNKTCYSKISDHFLDNVKKWEKEDISTEAYNKTIKLLNQNKIQRAIDTIYEFNYREYHLKAIMEFEEIKNLLPLLRGKKKRGKIDSITSIKEKNQLKNRLIKWIKKRYT